MLRTPGRSKFVDMACGQGTTTSRLSVTNRFLAPSNTQAGTGHPIRTQMCLYSVESKLINVVAIDNKQVVRCYQRPKADGPFNPVGKEVLRTPSRVNPNDRCH